MKIAPHTQFTPIEHNIATLLDGYGLHVASYKLADSGIENCTILVEATQGAYVLRIYRKDKKSDAGINRELAFIRYLESHHIPVAPPVPIRKAAAAQPARERLPHADHLIPPLCYWLHAHCRSKDE